MNFDNWECARECKTTSIPAPQLNTKCSSAHCKLTWVMSWGHTIRSATQCQSVSGTNTCFSDAAVSEVTKQAFPVLTCSVTKKQKTKQTHLLISTGKSLIEQQHTNTWQTRQTMCLTTFFVSLLSDRYVRTRHGSKPKWKTTFLNMCGLITVVQTNYYHL